MAGQTAEFRLSVQDYAAANLLHARRNWLAIGVGSAVVVGFGLWNVPWHSSTFAPGRMVEALLLAALTMVSVLVFLAIVLVSGFLLQRLLIPWQTRRFYQQHKSLQRPRKVSWDDDFLMTQSSEFNSRTPWTDFHKWRENKQVITLYVTDRMFHILPKRVLDQSQLADIGRLVRRKIAPKAGVKRKAHVAEVFS